MSTTLDRIHQAVIDGDRDLASEFVTKGLAEKIDPLTMLDSLNRGIRVVGDRFGKGELFIPDMVASADAMKAGAGILEPMILKRKGEIKTEGEVAIGTVEGDIHDIGKNIVAIMLSAAGFQVSDLGVDVSTETFIEAVRKNQPNLVGMSALLPSSMPSQDRVMKALNATGLRNKVKVMVGGAPVTEEWAASIGADGYAPDATLAVRKAHELVGK